MTKKLTAADKTKLRRASREEIEVFFATRKSWLKKARWLEASNRYKSKCIEKLSADLKARPTVVNDSNLRDYVSVSAPTHAIDGWSFLGRAVDASLRSDSASATHFAYYAELRAAMSILASEGLGVFNDKHAVIEDRGRIEYVHGGTHSLVWPALRHWAGLKKSVDALDGVVSVSGRGMSEWIDALAPTASVQAVADKWLGLWGMDLRLVSEDHGLRNLSSYRPSLLEGNGGQMPAKRTFEVIRDLWRLLEPSRGNRFPSLGRELLRNALRAVGRNLVVGSDLGFAGIGEQEADSLAAILSRPSESVVLEVAGARSVYGRTECHLQIVCRAALLLVIATHSSRRLLAAGNFSLETLSFWWIEHGVRHGLWAAGASPDDPLDTWSDVQNVIEEADAWFDNEGAASLFSARQALPSFYGISGGFELAGIWGLTP